MTFNSGKLMYVNTFSPLFFLSYLSETPIIHMLDLLDWTFVFFSCLISYFGCLFLFFFFFGLFFTYFWEVCVVHCIGSCFVFFRGVGGSQKLVHMIKSDTSPQRAHPVFKEKFIKIKKLFSLKQSGKNLIG